MPPPIKKPSKFKSSHLERTMVENPKQYKSLSKNSPGMDRYIKKDPQAKFNKMVELNSENPFSEKKRPKVTALLKIKKGTKTEPDPNVIIRPLFTSGESTIILGQNNYKMNLGNGEGYMEFRHPGLFQKYAEINRDGEGYLYLHPLQNWEPTYVRINGEWTKLGMGRLISLVDGQVFRLGKFLTLRLRFSEDSMGWYLEEHRTEPPQDPPKLPPSRLLQKPKKKDSAIMGFFNSLPLYGGFPFSMFFGILFNGGRFLKNGAIQLEFTSDQSRLVLGRGGEKMEGVHVPLDHENIENQHAMISRDETGQIFITDLKGEEGTWVWMNQGWQRLTPFWPYPIQKGSRLAFGKVEGEQESLFLDKRLALSYEVKEGKSPNSLILDPQIIIRNKRADTSEVIDPKNHLRNKSFSAFYGSLAQKFKNAFSRGIQDPFQLQDKANTFERKGQLGKAEAIHQKAVFIGRTLYRGATELSPYAFNKPARDWGVVRDNYGEFLKRQHRWEEAAAQFEQAGQLLLLANLNTTEDIIRLATKAKAYHIFRGLAEEANVEENPAVAAVFFERAGHNVPWTFEVNSLGNDWDPLLTFIQMKAHAALNYRLAGEEYKRHYQTVWANLSRVTKYVRPEGFQRELGQLFSALKELVDNGIIRSHDIGNFVQTEIDILRLKYGEE